MNLGILLTIGEDPQIPNSADEVVHQSVSHADPHHFRCPGSRHAKSEIAGANVDWSIHFWGNPLRVDEISLSIPGIQAMNLVPQTAVDEAEKGQEMFETTNGFNLDSASSGPVGVAESMGINPN